MRLAESDETQEGAIVVRCVPPRGAPSIRSFVATFTPHVHLSASLSDWYTIAPVTLGPSPWLIAVALFVALTIFGARVHWVEESRTAEHDGYVAQAERVLRGIWPTDRFRPPLFTLAIAGIARWTGDAFVTARGIANLSAATVALLAFGFAKRLAGPERGERAGWWAMAFVAVNPNTWRYGQHTTTDMPFAALAAAALLAGLAYLQSPSVAAAACTGLAFGAAAGTRGNAILIAPALLIAWALGVRMVAPATRARAWAHLALAGGLAMLVMLPNWVVRARVFGNPWFDENWKNLVFKLHGYPDWSVFEQIPSGGSFTQVLLAEPAAVAWSALSELAVFVLYRARQLLGTWLHVAAAVVGAWLCLYSRSRREAGWLLIACGLFIVGLATVFFTWVRLLLVLLAPLAGLAAAGAQMRLPSPVWTRLVAASGMFLVLVLMAKTAFFEIPAFVGRHPYAEVAALQRLEGMLQSHEALAGTAPFVDRYLTHPYVVISGAIGTDADNPEAYLARLLPELRKRRVAFLVVGTTELGRRPRMLLEGSPPGLELVERNPQVTTWRLLPHPQTDEQIDHTGSRR
jgi:4-amino-4-deoxy-L-arabinose transferase-like glycosyltransferase